MTARDTTVLHRLVASVAGPARTDGLMTTMVVHPALAGATGDRASRAVIAQALNMLLFADLIDRVPAAAAYVAERVAAGGTLCLFSVNGVPLTRCALGSKPYPSR